MDHPLKALSKLANQIKRKRQTYDKFTDDKLTNDKHVTSKKNRKHSF